MVTTRMLCIKFPDVVCKNINIYVTFLPIFVRVKYLAFILGLLLQVLTCFPCSDTEECTPVQITVTDHPVTTHDNHRHENESCSPFCVCSCCAAVTVFVPEIYPLFPEIKKFETRATYIIGQEQLHSYEDQNIWQPPQLS